MCSICVCVYTLFACNVGPFLVTPPQSLAHNGGNYFIRMKTKLSDEQEGEYVSTFISAVSHVIKV